MATARSSQSHQKRVQQIATEAAEKIAAEAPLEEDVLVVVEELPPGELARTGSGRSKTKSTTQDAPLEVVAQSQQVLAETMASFAAMFDARRLTTEGFRLAEEILASQKEFALKVVEAMTPSRAAYHGGAAGNRTYVIKPASDSAMTRVMKASQRSRLRTHRTAATIGVARKCDV